MDGFLPRHGGAISRGKASLPSLAFPACYSHPAWLLPSDHPSVSLYLSALCLRMERLYSLSIAAFLLAAAATVSLLSTIKNTHFSTCVTFRFRAFGRALLQT
jgi:hypothetical protein